MEQIASSQNSKIKLVNRLRSKRAREQEGRFLIENRRDLQRALRQGFVIDFALVCPQIAGESGDTGELGGRVYQITPQILKQLSYRENPSGFIAVMLSNAGRCLQDLADKTVSSIIVLDDLRKPGNIGALLRTALAAGIDAIFLVDSALDLYNPNIIRSSTGACFHGNIYHLTGQEAIGFLKEREFQIVAADASAELSLYQVDFLPRTAVILGTEDQGLRSFWADHCDQVACIPMFGTSVDSLNVSVTGAIFMYEMRRQRGSA